MARKPRVHVPGGFYHTTLRGNSRQDVFDCDSDRHLWESLISHSIERCGHRLHAYCWMTNHVHLAIQAGAEPLAGFMSLLASNYARKTNLRKRRSGHLFERRYRAILVQEDSYLLPLIRYIHLNPIRAGMVDMPAGYRWSSHHAYMGGPRPHWLTTGTALSLFASDEARARRRYARFMGQTPDPDMVRRLQSGSKTDDRVLGTDQWLTQVLGDVADPLEQRSLDELVSDTCASHGIDEPQLASPSRARHLAAIRAEIALAATTNGIASISEVARRFGRAQPTLSRAMCRLRDRRNKL